jgi:hypothetical protein
MWKVFTVAALAGAAFLLGGEGAEAATCMKIEVPAAGGGITPLELLVPDSAIATYQAKGFAQVSCPAGEVYTAERAEAACQKFAGFPSEAKDAISQTYGVTTTEICEQARAAVAEGS